MTPFTHNGLAPRLRLSAGIVIILCIIALGLGGFRAVAGQSGGQVREYFIAADEINWDYAPLKMNAISGQPFDEVGDTYTKNDHDRIGSIYRKAVYREYTDSTFKTLKPIAPEWQHLGVLGPVIRAEVGDTIVVHFTNNTGMPTSIHPHGVFYKKDSEGAPYNDGTNGADKADDTVAPGGTYTYHWDVPERAGPGMADASSVLWMYHSHANEIGDTYAGLIGPLIVTAKGKAKADGSPKDVDREFVVMFHIFNENLSPYLPYNVEHFPGKAQDVKLDDEDFIESNLKHSMNGYLFGNLPGLTMKKGDHVRWYLIGMGTEADIHTPHWHGNTVLMNGMNRSDMAMLMPGMMMSADMIPDDVGTWLFHCHVNDHIKAGMMALYTVTP